MCDSQQVKRNYYIPQWIDEGLETLNKRTGESKAYHVRRALEKYLEENGITPERQQKK